MNILGINAFDQNPAACLVIDGKLVGFSHEERFNRLKCSHKMFPSLAINWLLKSNRMTLSDIDIIAFGWNVDKYPYKMLGHLAKQAVKSKFINSPYKHKNYKNASIVAGLEELLHFNRKGLSQKIRDSLRESGHSGDIPKIEFRDHHLSHAYQSFYQSSFEKSIVLVADGHGEEYCISGYLVDKGEFKRIYSKVIPYSLGWFYSGFTAYLGFHPNRDEGKLMGLAAYGEYNRDNNPWLERLDKILKINETGFEMNPYYFKMGNNSFHSRYTDNLYKFITDYDSTMTPLHVNEIYNKTGKYKYLEQKYIDLAFASQTKLEEALSSIVSYMVKQTGVTNLCTAGGVFMNCKANRAILDNSGIKNIFIHPASSDDGSAIGAAFILAKECGDNPRNILTNVQQGASFSNDDVLKAVKSAGLKFLTPEDITSDTAKLLSEGKYAGWFQGASEMGARALGGRSIIASPHDVETKTNINRRVKFREEWRPYCPSMLYETKDKYLVNAVESPFMILASEATEALKKCAKATVHIDGTVRPQTVRKEYLPKWYEMIKNVGEFTNNPVVLNTSFNVRGEPIVNSPFDAIRTFYSTGLDFLAIEDVLIMK